MRRLHTIKLRSRGGLRNKYFGKKFATKYVLQAAVTTVTIKFLKVTFGDRTLIASSLRIIGCCFALLSVYSMWLDMTSSNKVSNVFGQFWFEHSLTSLQVAETIVSRYVDPCGLFISIGCEPFLWHPLIVTSLGWPAALIFIFLTLIFFGLARLINRRSLRRSSGRSLKRSGER